MIMIRPMKPLLVYLQPKDIPEVRSEFEKLDIDRIAVKYVGYEHHPHLIAQDEFLRRKEYTHMVLYTNDVIVKQEHIQRLIQQVRTFHDDIPVFCGVMNVDTAENKDVWNICMRLPDKDFRTRKYDWVKKGDIDGCWKVEFAGFPLMCIRRDILEEIRLEGDHWDGHVDAGSNTDLVFCWNCKEKGISIICDTGLEMKHLRYHEELQIGKKTPEIEYFIGDRHFTERLWL